eukprot:g67461.t1
MNDHNPYDLRLDPESPSDPSRSSLPEVKGQRQLSLFRCFLRVGEPRAMNFLPSTTAQQRGLVVSFAVGWICYYLYVRRKEEAERATPTPYPIHDIPKRQTKVRGEVLQSSPPPLLENRFQVMFLGTGVSTGIPILGHALGVSECKGPCLEAVANPHSKNWRNNVSILIKTRQPNGECKVLMVDCGKTMRQAMFVWECKVLMVDCGKTMRQAMLQHAHRLGVSSVDAVLLTHDHADAVMGGCDDLRDLQKGDWERVGAGKVDGPEDKDNDLGFRIGGGPMQIVASHHTLDSFRRIYPYLCGKPELLAPGLLRRRVAYIELVPIHERDSISVHGLHIEVFPLLHGGSYVCLGFVFGPKDAPSYPLVYMSDVKIVPPETMQVLKAKRIEVLIVDALSDVGMSSHFSIPEALDFTRMLKPRRTLFVGMTCEVGDHDAYNSELSKLRASEVLDVQLAFDGQLLENPSFCL